MRDCKDCAPPISHCKLTPVLLERYRSLAKDSTYLFAVNLYNSEHILGNLIKELKIVLEFLGINHTMVSIYESGSNDKSRLLLNIFALELETIGISNFVSTGMDPVHWGKVLRIEALAKIRNYALKPLYDDVENVLKNHSIPKFSKVVFLNDIVFCASDILELILQQSKSGAVMACPLDFETFPAVTSFYDLWVTRTMAGDLLYNAFNDYKDGASNKSIGRDDRGKLRSSKWNRRDGSNIFWKDPIGKLRASKGLPVQVYSCWNGGVVIDSRPFYDFNLKFRAGYRSECKESECSLFSKDLWNSGYGKIAIIPNIIVSYSIKQYLYFRTKWETLKSPLDTPKPFYASQLSIDYKYNVSYPIDWKPIPALVRCFELAEIGNRYVNWVDTELIDPSIEYKNL